MHLPSILVACSLPSWPPDGRCAGPPGAARWEVSHACPSVRRCPDRRGAWSSIVPARGRGGARKRWIPSRGHPLRGRATRPSPARATTPASTLRRLPRRRRAGLCAARARDAPVAAPRTGPGLRSGRRGV